MYYLVRVTTDLSKTQTKLSIRIVDYITVERCIEFYYYYCTIAGVISFSPMSHRILCLHGWTMNSNLFEAAMAPLASALRGAGFSLVFINAPHPAGPDHDKGARTWWTIDSSLSSRVGENGRVSYGGWPVSRAAIMAEWSENAVGLLGFSQGGVAVHTLLEELMATPTATTGTSASGMSSISPLHLTPPQFAILSGGFPSRRERSLHEKTPSPLITIPSLHAIGKRDKLVLPEQQHQLTQRFLAPEILDFESGHRMPYLKHDIDSIVSFCLNHMDGGASASGGGGGDFS